MKNLFWVLVAVLIVSVASADEANSNIGGIVGDVIAGVPSVVTENELTELVTNNPLNPVVGRVSASETLEVISLVPGDVTRDGVLDISDVVRLLRGVVGLEWQNDDYYLLGDLTPLRAPGDDTPTNIRYAVGDGMVTISDVVAALRASIGLVEIKFPGRMISVEVSESGSPIVVQGIVARFTGPYHLLDPVPALYVDAGILNLQQGSHTVGENADYYMALGFVGTNEVLLDPGSPLVKMSWEGPMIGFGGFDSGYQVIETADGLGNILRGDRCDDPAVFQFRYLTMVPGFDPEGEVYHCFGG